MTNEEQARVLVDTLDRDFTNRDGTWCDVERVYEFVTTALRAKERETWEEAAKMLDEDEVLESPDELDPRCKCQCFGILGMLSNKCRQRAAAVGEEQREEKMNADLKYIG